jgi:hypothetical protein
MENAPRSLFIKALIVGGSVLIVMSLVGVSLLSVCDAPSEPPTPPATPPESLYSGVPVEWSEDKQLFSHFEVPEALEPSDSMD